jgi:hypothetical protein
VRPLHREILLISVRQGEKTKESLLSWSVLVQLFAFASGFSSRSHPHEKKNEYFAHDVADVTYNLRL